MPTWTFRYFPDRYAPATNLALFPSTIVGLEAASQSWDAGFFVTTSLSTGLSSIFGAASSVLDTADGLIAGMAATYATGVTSTPFDIIPITPGMVFRFPYSLSGVESATAQAQVSKSYALYWHATKGIMVDGNVTANALVTVKQIAPDYPVGEVGGLLEVTFIQGVFAN